MGSTASKPTETKVFTPKANVELGSSLINELEKSPETDYTRSQYTEKTFQAELGKKLDQLTKESQEKFDKELKSAVLTKDTDKDKSLSSKDIATRLEKFQESLSKRQSKIFKITDEVAKAKDDVAQCLLTNKKQPLNCWDEVAKFEQLVAQIN